jgi:D-glucosaminate-6-phosphate ammonia-lyase
MFMSNHSNRRRFLKAATAVSALGSRVAPGATGRAKETTLAGGNIYTRLGIRPVINGIGVVTILGGSIMPAEVMQAMEEAAKFFVPLPELQQKAGAKIAALVGVPGAMVTAGCASSITVATAACIARGDAERLSRLPDTCGMKNEIVQQKSHLSGYEAQIQLVGARIVWVETREELDRAINDRTAMMFFLNKANSDGRIRREEWIQVGQNHGVPTFCDAASDLPPAAHLSQYVRDGFDLVGLSGGKALLGPQCSGLLLGRKDLIEAGLLAISPNDGIGRGMKVGKEEIMGLVAAIERYLKVDHEAENRELEARVEHIVQVLSGINGLRAQQSVPEIANHVPHVSLEWNSSIQKLTSKQVVQMLHDGDPPIAVLDTEEGRLLISVWMMRGTEHQIVAKRLREIFKKG